MNSKSQSNRKGRYSTSRSRVSRRRDMKKDAESSGYGRTIRNVKLRSNLLKNKSPAASKEMKKDVAYLKRQKSRSRK